MRTLVLFFILAFFAVSCNNDVVNDNMAGQMEGMEHGQMTENAQNSNYKKMCQSAGYEWMVMKPTKDGKIIQSEKSCWGCMVEGIEHVCDMHKYIEITALSPNLELKTGDLKENSPALLQFWMTNPDGTPAEPVISHEKLMHAIIIRDDFSSFSHTHPEYKKNGLFELNYEFTRGGKYIIGADYATKDGQFSKKFIVNVEGDSESSLDRDFSTKKNFAGYDVKLTAGSLKEGQESTLKFYIEKDGTPVKDLEPYLAAAMHIAIVKQDLSEFLHVHGEAHEASDSMMDMDDMMEHGSSHEHETPSAFGPEIEAHVNFPAKGMYNVFGEFSHEGNVVVTSFMVEVK